MLTAILLIAAAISYASIHAAYNAAYSNRSLFAVSLPADAMENDDIREVQARYRRRKRKVEAWMLALLVPFLLLHGQEALQAVYFLLWLPTLIVCATAPFRRAFRETLAIKHRNGWLAEHKRAIAADLRAARLKNQRSAPLALFAIPFAVALGIIAWFANADRDWVGFASAGLWSTAVLFVVALLTRGTRAKVYSTDSEVNVLVNQSRQTVLSYLWLALALAGNIQFALLAFVFANGSSEWIHAGIAASALFAAVPLSFIVVAINKIQRRQQELLQLSDGEPVFIDEDEYWANGFTYHNPRDRKLFVEKRVGVGVTINTGTLAGKIIAGSILAVTVAVIAGVVFLLVRSELTSPKLTIAQDREIAIDYPMYSFDFEVSEIERIQLVDDLPSSVRVNGEGTSKHARGKFRSPELGDLRMYVFKKNPPYIRIELPDLLIYYNEEDPAETATLYARLQALVADAKRE